MAKEMLDGEAAPQDGSLPPLTLRNIESQPLSFYVHVPFCASRCGYCDFNTYTAEELGPNVSRSSWRESAIAEVRLAKKVLGHRVPVSTVFVGGGTPTLLPAADLADVIDAIDAEFGLVENCEITTEANPDSVTAESLETLRVRGFNRISFGMQSTAPHVLRILERTHTPGRAAEAVTLAKAAGFEHINLDMIYGTPSETVEDLQKTLDAVLATQVDHVSAYSLIVEEGTRLFNAVKRGAIPMPDDDDMADKYELIDATLAGAGFEWYEVSNWAQPGGECRHNLAYWRSTNWWGIGPGAHSHVNGVRWWNKKHPTSWTQDLASGNSPAQAREVIDSESVLVEKVMLKLRLREGMKIADLPDASLVEAEVESGLLEIHNGHAVLTPRGRLVADGVIHRLLWN